MYPLFKKRFGASFLENMLVHETGQQLYPSDTPHAVNVHTSET